MKVDRKHYTHSLSSTDSTKWGFRPEAVEECLPFKFVVANLKSLFALHHDETRELRDQNFQPLQSGTNHVSLQERHTRLHSLLTIWL